VLRSDNWGEDTSIAFKEFCEKEGIKTKLTILYNLQQNGFAKKNNRAIVGEVRVMLHDQSLLFFLWDEPCSTVVYVHNISPHHACNNPWFIFHVKNIRPK